MTCFKTWQKKTWLGARGNLSGCHDLTPPSVWSTSVFSSRYWGKCFCVLQQQQQQQQVIIQFINKYIIKWYFKNFVEISTNSQWRIFLLIFSFLGLISLDSVLILSRSKANLHVDHYWEFKGSETAARVLPDEMPLCCYKTLEMEK